MSHLKSPIPPLAPPRDDARLGSNSRLAAIDKRYLSQSSVAFYGRSGSVVEQDKLWLRPPKAPGILHPLPPMAGGPQDGIQGRKFISASYAGPDMRIQDLRYSRRKYLRRMSEENSQRVVSFLRKRFRDRENQWQEDTDEGDSLTNHERPGKIVTKSPEKFSVFKQYNEIGGRLSKEGNISDGLYPGVYVVSPVKPKTPLAPLRAPVNIKEMPKEEREKKAKELFSKIEKDWEAMSEDISDDETVQSEVKKNLVPMEMDAKFDKSSKHFDDDMDVVSVANSEFSKTSKPNSIHESVNLSRDLSTVSISDGKVNGIGESRPERRNSFPIIESPGISKDNKNLRKDSISFTDSNMTQLPLIEGKKDQECEERKESMTAENADDVTNLKLPNMENVEQTNETSEGVSTIPIEGSLPNIPDRSYLVSPVLTPTPKDVESLEKGMEQHCREVESSDGVCSLGIHEGVDDVTEMYLFRGDIQHVYALQRKTIAIYISSTFSDMESERTIFTSKTFPKFLKPYFAEHGYELEVVDPHWGIKDVWTNDHSHEDICINELERAKETSQGPFFLTLAGQKLGYQPLPKQLTPGEFEHIVTTLRQEREDFLEARRLAAEAKAAVEAERQRKISQRIEEAQKNGTYAARRSSIALKNQGRRASTFGDQSDQEKEDPEVVAAKAAEKEFDDNIAAMETWYRLDNNQIPPAYILQNISSEFKEFLSSDKLKRQRAKTHWSAIFKRLHKIMNKYYEDAVVDSRKYQDFLKPVSEKELAQAVGDVTFDPKKQAFGITRQISNLRKNLQDFTAKDYIDLHHQKSEVDDNIYAQTEQFRKKEILLRLGQSNVQDFTVRWHKDGISAQSDRTHSLYLDSLNQSLFDNLKAKFEQSVLREPSQGPSGSLYEEVAQHANFAHERCKIFYGRKVTLQVIKEYLLGSSDQPLVLFGESGIGKSSVIAKAVDLVPQWFKGSACNIVFRFIGCTPPSEELRYLLRSVGLQICKLYDVDHTTIPEDIYGLMNDFESRLNAADTGTPLVIFLDGVNQLRNQKNAQMFNWLPKSLPRNVKVVMTTVESEESDILKRLKRQCPEAQFENVQTLTKKEMSYLFNFHLSRANRTLTEEQRETAMALCSNNPTPLYLELVCSSVVQWKSFSEKREMYMQSELRKLINANFVQLENVHGEIIVRRALGYITAAHSGVSHSEMQDLLSLDDAVMMEIINHNATRLWRFPTVLWSRLRNDLGALLSEVKADGNWVYRWSHLEVKTAATDRYLNSKDKAPSYHTALAEYFLGRWADRRKPYPGSESGAERYVDEQRLYVRSAGYEYSESTHYNLRKLRELPYHLHQSNQMNVLKSEVLFNYKWMLTKLKAISFNEVVSDLQSALAVEPNDSEMRLMSDTLQLSKEALCSNPNQLASQLIGRLHRIIQKDQPRAIGDMKKYPNILEMLQQANNTIPLALIPSITCLAEPGGILNDLLAGHTDVITAVGVTMDGVFAATASKDNTIKMWDLRNRRVTKTIHKTGMQITKLLFLLDTTYIAAVQNSHIFVFRASDGALTYTNDDHIDPPVIISAGEHGQYLVAFFNGSNVICTWDSQSDFSLKFEREFVQSGIHKDGSLCLAMQTNGSKCLYAFRSDNVAYVMNVTDGRRVFELSAPKEGASITALAISRDFYILVCRYIYMHLSEIHYLELFDFRSGEYVRGIKGCPKDCIKDLYINKTSSHALCVCTSVRNNSSEILVWNLDTDEHKHMAKHPKISNMAACTDLNFVLTASETDKALKIWNISKNINDRDTTDGSHRAAKQGIGELVPMLYNTRYVVAKTINNGPVSVWNVVKGKCAGSAVRIERGLTEIYDVVLIRDDKIVILSDIGESKVSDNPMNVFQTIFVYCLKTKKYIRKISPVFIVPSPAHEYHLLEGELLMGLSESRDHLIVWCLVTGQIKYRIKRNHNKSELWRAPREDDEEVQVRLKRMGTAEMTPWDRRSESKGERSKRKEQEADAERKKIENRRQEKENAIAQYMLSKDERVVVCSYFAHHLVVFDVASQTHVHTLEEEDSMLYLYTASLTSNGSHLAHTNYDNTEKVSYITIWNLGTGSLYKRLKNEPDVCCIGMNDSASRVLIGNQKNVLKVWDVRRKNSTLRKLALPSESFKLDAESKIFMMANGAKALVFANDLTLWNLDDGTLLATFTPDLRISCVEVVMDGELIVLALMNSSDVITLRLKGQIFRSVCTPASRGLIGGQELFGETTGDSSDEGSDVEEEEQDGSGRV